MSNSIHMHTYVHMHTREPSLSLIFAADSAGSQWEQNQNPSSSVTQTGAWAQGPTPTRCVFAPLSYAQRSSHRRIPRGKAGRGSEASKPHQFIQLKKHLTGGLFELPTISATVLDVGKPNKTQHPETRRGGQIQPRSTRLNGSNDAVCMQTAIQ